MSHKYPCVYYDNGKCQKFSDDQYSAWCDFDQCEHITPSNADHIRSMTDDKLAWRMMQLNFCPPNIDEYKVCGKDANCHQCWVDWLKQPYKEDT